jgi:hypothetical protein
MLSHSTAEGTKTVKETWQPDRLKELNREDKDKMHRILEFVQNSTVLHDNRYLKMLNAERTSKV